MTDRSKRFSHKGLTHSAAHHLLAVEHAINSQGYARVADIARKLGITRGSVSVAMQSLKASGHVDQDENHFFHLTETGRNAAASIRGRHEIVELFLQEVLGLSTEQSHRESCRMENLIEATTARRLHALIAYWRQNDLKDVLSRQSEPECPVCRGEDWEQCPCCGLECLEGECPQAASRAG